MLRDFDQESLILEIHSKEIIKTWRFLFKNSNEENFIKIVMIGINTYTIN